MQRVQHKFREDCVRLFLKILRLWAVAVLAAPVMAADWKPANPVEIVIPNAPGGGNDAVGRLLQRIWQDRKLTATPGIVVNKAGGGGTVALTYLAQKPNDPHAMAVVSIARLRPRS